MTCQEFQHWLLLSRPADAPPGAVRRHLIDCARCRQRREKLRLLDEQMAALAPPRPNPAARARMLARVAATPQAPPASPPLPTRRIHLPWVFAAAAAGLLVIVGAWHIAQRPAAHRPPDGAVARPADDNPKVAPFRAGDGELVRLVARLDVRLAAPTPAEEQLDLLTLLAENLTDEAIRLARAGPSEDVSLLGDLAAYVLRQGVVARAARLPADKRPQLVPPLVRRLLDAEAEVDRCRQDALPVVADMLRPLGAAARESADLIEAGRTAAPAKGAPASGTAPPLIATLVAHGLRLADEDDPVRRADLAADLASLLAPAIVLCSASGDEDGAEDLGDCLDDLRQGMGANLKQAEEDGLPPARRAEADKVRERSDEAMGVLERNLEQLPPPARKGVERALEAGKGNKPKPKDKHPLPPPRGNKKPKK